MITDDVRQALTLHAGASAAPPRMLSTHMEESGAALRLPRRGVSSAPLPQRVALPHQLVRTAAGDRMRRRWAGVTGMVLAMVALTATIWAEHVLPEPPRPAVRATVNVTVGRLNFGWRSKSREAPPPAPEPLFSRERVR